MCVRFSSVRIREEGKIGAFTNALLHSCSQFSSLRKRTICNIILKLHFYPFFKTTWFYCMYLYSRNWQFHITVWHRTLLPLHVLCSRKTCFLMLKNGKSTFSRLFGAIVIGYLRRYSSHIVNIAISSTHHWINVEIKIRIFFWNSNSLSNIFQVTNFAKKTLLISNNINLNDLISPHVPVRLFS